MSAADLSIALAAWRLPGADRPLPGRCLQDREWEHLHEEVDRQRLWGLLGAAASAGALPATDRQAARAEAIHRQAMRSVLELEAMAVTAHDLLAGAGIPVRLLKGLAVAHLDEAEPSLRCFNDVDLLVAGEHIGEAVRLLDDAGYERDLPERRRGYDQRFAKEVTLTGPRGREIDLHRTLADGGLGLAIAVDDLWREPEVVVLAGRTLAAVDADLRLLNACYGALLGDPVPRLVLLRDVGLLLGGGKLDVDRVVATAQRWHGDAVVAAAVRLAAATFNASGWPLLDWAQSHVPSRRAERLLRCYRSQGGSNTQVLLSGLLAPIGWAPRAAYARALAFPSRDYELARRRAGRPAERRTGMLELLRRRTG